MVLPFDQKVMLTKKIWFATVTRSQSMLVTARVQIFLLARRHEKPLSPIQPRTLTGATSGLCTQKERSSGFIVLGIARTQKQLVTGLT